MRRAARRIRRCDHYHPTASPACTRPSRRWWDERYVGPVPLATFLDPIVGVVTIVSLVALVALVALDAIVAPDAVVTPTCIVMAGLVRPSLAAPLLEWMAGTSPAMTMEVTPGEVTACERTPGEVTTGAAVLPARGRHP